MSRRMAKLIDVDLGTRSRAERFFCPLTGREVRCVLLEDTERGDLVGVERCSRFEPEDDLRCDQRCVDMLDDGFTLDSDGDG